jgi:hypothetical protein
MSCFLVSENGHEHHFCTSCENFFVFVEDEPCVKCFRWETVHDVIPKYEKYVNAERKCSWKIKGGD